MGMWGCGGESRDLPEQHASAISFPILIETDYAPHSVPTHLGRTHKPYAGGCVCDVVPFKSYSHCSRDVINSTRLLTVLPGINYKS